jgi:predicted nucleotidyltransferase
MKITGIIAEYNPFHNGHLYHLNKSMQLTGSDYSIAVMSGNFLQRGEPALYNKWIRAEMAVRNGIDLVLELPFAFACNNADYFARGAVGILDGLGCVDYLSFGSESGNIQESSTAKILADENRTLSEAIKEEMMTGVSYPKGRCEAMKKLYPESICAPLMEPNNILGVEYLKQLILLNSQLKPITIPRFATGYHDIKISGTIASATAIRKAMIEENRPIESLFDVIPPATLGALKEKESIKAASINDFYSMIQYKIVTSAAENLNKIFSITEGLEFKLLASAAKANTIDGLIKAVKSKRYTETRVKRLIIQTLMNLTKEKMSLFSDLDHCLYGRILAISNNGKKIVKHIKKQECGRIPIITNINKESHLPSGAKELLKYDILAATLYNIAESNNLYDYSDQVMRLFSDENIHDE